MHNRLLLTTLGSDNNHQLSTYERHCEKQLCGGLACGTSVNFPFWVNWCEWYPSRHQYRQVLLHNFKKFDIITANQTRQQQKVSGREKEHHWQTTVDKDRRWQHEYSITRRIIFGYWWDKSFTDCWSMRFVSILKLRYIFYWVSTYAKLSFTFISLPFVSIGNSKEATAATKQTDA